MVRYHLVTLFREACEPYLNASILGRAQKGKLISVTYQNPRDFVPVPKGAGKFPYKKTDERPYGGGPGMVMMAMPIIKATEKALKKSKGKSVIVWFTPGAKQFNNKEADMLAKYDDVVFVCGRYEGIDERALKVLKTMASVKTYAVGEAVYTGGEVPAMAMIDAISRRIPGVLGKFDSVEENRVASRAVYTRPETISYKGKNYTVPKVLLTGHHKKIDTWREKK
jgi:tRNA (guanine37-N1)-methyltransferase